MAYFSLLPVVAGLFTLLLASFSLLRRPSPARWYFFAGMSLLGADSLVTGLFLGSSEAHDGVGLQTLSFLMKATIPAIWLPFSLTYARGDYRQSVSRWRIPIIVFAVLPTALVLTFRGRLFEVMAVTPTSGVLPLKFGPTGTALNVILLVGLVLILTNLEQTFRSAVGTIRWRIKFVVLALGVIFAARLYVRGQAILFYAPDITLWGVESGSLLIGCVLLTVAYVRTEWSDIEVYPSRAVVRSSLTVLIVGLYLFVVGVLAQIVKRFGGAEIFQFQSFVVLTGLAGLAVLLLSDRGRHRIEFFVGRHFRKAQHDSVRIWTLFSRGLASGRDRSSLCTVAAKLISDTFDALSVTIWLTDEDRDRLVIAASSSQGAREHSAARFGSSDIILGLRSHSVPFDLEVIREPWAEELRLLNPPTFTRGGNRVCVPLRLTKEEFGVIVVADRVSGAVYTQEELELLQCIGVQIASAMYSAQLSGEVARARELEAFRTMSAFFVHDLKNAATSLNLTLKNLPVHFNDPDFRQDTLRGIGNTARRIDDIIARLSAVRGRPELKLVKSDLNQLITGVLEELDEISNVQLSQDLRPLPPVLADREQIRSVVTNLVLNARDAIGVGGRIQVRTEPQGERVVLSVADNGRGMSDAFIKDSLFRPFQSTKQNGLGIGLFQSRWIVQAHGGGMHVTSEPGKGTTFVINLPATGDKV